MARIRYTGGSHYRELSTADLQKFGVEGFEDTTWARGEATEVEQDIADALLLFLGDEFEEVPDSERAFIPGQRKLPLITDEGDAA